MNEHHTQTKPTTSTTKGDSTGTESGTQDPIASSLRSAGGYAAQRAILSPSTVQMKGEGDPKAPAPAPAAHSDALLRWGSKGPDVTAAQTRLNAHGATPPLAVDGDFGSKTHAAVVAFQGANALVKDGIVGPKTWEKLDAEPGKVVPPPKVDTSLVPEGKKTAKEVEDESKASANPERAALAIKELRALQAAEKADPKRLGDGIINLLVWGVATRMNATDLGTEGLIGVHHANNAAVALQQMPEAAYLQIVGKLVLSSDTKNPKADPRVESILVLKAVAARKADFADAGKRDKAAADVVKFAGDIHDQDAETLKKECTLRDHGDGEGLQQKWTMSCGPTSIQITHGESDPIYAREVSRTAKHNLEYDNSVGTQQKDYLAQSAVPRKVKTRYESFVADSKARGVSHPADTPKLMALHQDISGLPTNAPDLAGGQAWANGAGYTNAELAEFKKFYPFGEPGWQNSDFQTKANAEISNRTNARFNERAIPPQYKNIAGQMRPVSTMKKADCDALYEALLRGKDIPMGIMWYGGGGHFMVFTDCRTKKEGGKDVRSYLLSDPWQGTSAWITEDNVLLGDVSPFGKGAIDSIYL